MQNVSEIRQEFVKLLENEEFVTDKSGVKTIELIGASFIADEPAIFGKPNYDYISREIAWYESLSKNVNDIPGKTPEIWKQVATPDGEINSNYGHLIYSHDNYDQYEHVLKELKANQHSRRAVMIYQRPSMWLDYNRGGMSDFICTMGVGYNIRNNKLNAIVQMRSNDAIFGYPNDVAWQKHVLEELAADLSMDTGNIYWNAMSLHVYERHFDKVLS